MESISRISNLLESARELTLDASSAARSSFRNPTTARPLDNRQIKKLLDSRAEREVLDGLRRVTTMACRGQKTLPFFSSVVKNVASPNIEIKKLVYIYVVHHAEQEPDMALLSINTIQKSLSDSNPQVRALALRTMSAIRVPVISQIVSLAIKKGAADMSPYVRRAAALAIPKCYRLDPSQLPQLIEYLVTLLGDKQYYVAGAAVTAFLAVCPERLDLIHAHYRDLVKKLVDMDEWSQLATLRMLTVYARKCFPRRTKKVAVKAAGNSSSQARTKAARTLDLGDFYGEPKVDNSNGNNDSVDVDLASASSSAATTQTVVDLDPDLVLLLNAIRPLLQSRNAGVVAAVTRCYVSIGTPEYVRDAVGPLVALLRGPQDIQQIALYNIASVCLAYPADFVRYASRFLVRATDPPAVWRLKLEVLALLFPHSPATIKSLILSELEHFARGSDKALVREAVRAIGRCAQAAESTTNTIDTATAARCLRLLLAQVTSLDGTLAAESLTVIRHLIQQDPAAHGPTVVRLAKNLDAAADPQARATIIWLVGEFSGLNGEDNIAADVLRILLKGFAGESEAAKRQIVLLAAKVYLHHINREAERNPKPTLEEMAVAAAAAESKTTPTPASQSNMLPEGFADDGGFAEMNERPRSPSPAPTPPSEPDHPIRRLWDYVLLLARYDTSYDLRDRTRLYRALLEVPQLATLMLLAPKPVPHAPSPSEVRRGFTLGSAALILGAGGDGSSTSGGGLLEDGQAHGHGRGMLLHGIRGYEPLPDWVRDGDEPDPRLRETEDSIKQYEERQHGGGVSSSSYTPAGDSLDQAAARGRGSIVRATNGGQTGMKKVGAKTLDDWLDEEEEEEEESDDDEEEEEDSSEEEEDDDEEEESEEEEEDEEEESSEEEEEDESDSGEEGDRLIAA
ncbi:AP-3 complex subunit beta [Sporothrix bragantina]|uniref:AP-3 complex subunit beta n=1 Tax=Sporothrix bragantina TaxID=671064 RepID=A0ABP0BS23_9PEZI